MVPFRNKAKRLLSVNHTTKTIQFISLKLGGLQHLISVLHCWQVDCLDHRLLAKSVIRHQATFDMSKYTVLPYALNVSISVPARI